MSGIVQRAPVTHVCRPGFRYGEPNLYGGEMLRPLLPVHCRIGDVWECDCGKRYVAKDSPSNYATVGSRTVGRVEWHEVKPPRRHWWKR